MTPLAEAPDHTTENGKPLLSSEAIQAAFDGKHVFEASVLNGRDMRIEAVTFSSFSGEKIGVFEIGTDASGIVAEARAALWTMAGVILLSSLIALSVFFWFAKSLGNAIGRLTGTMSRLATGDLSAQIQGGERADETGAMARAVQVFKDNALKNTGTRAPDRQASHHH